MYELVSNASREEARAQFQLGILGTAKASLHVVSPRRVHSTRFSAGAFPVLTVQGPFVFPHRRTSVRRYSCIYRKAI